MNKQKIFLRQIITAIIIFSITSFFVKKAFNNSSKVDTYINFDKGLKTMSKSTSWLLDSLIIKNEVTFDPTSGKSIDKVFKNLKNTLKDKFVMVGSSQLRVVQGEKLELSYTKLVSEKVESYANNNIEVYNLSLGGMTINEKLLIAKKTLGLLNPKSILISVTPWDCISDKIRNTVKDIEDAKYTLKKITKTKNKNFGLSENRKFVFPIRTNKKISNYTENIVKDNIVIYGKRAAIKKWLGDVITLKKKEAINTNIPDYWRTLDQYLNDTSGWDNEEYRTGIKSVKIHKNKVKNAKWLGDIIQLAKPTKTVEFAGWSKAENVSEDTKLYCLDFQVIFEDGTNKWYYKNLKFSKGTHDWQKVKTKVTFDKKIVSIKPHMLFYGGVGTVWFDDIKVIPIVNGKREKNILPNPSFEKELKGRVNLSYYYDDKKWTLIKQHIFSVVDFLSNQNIEKPILLITPFWHDKDKSAYPQKTKYTELLNSIKNYCKEKKVVYIDASYILSKDDFGAYTQGSVRDKIDVLHFKATGHNKLAKYIIKELKL